MSNMIKTNQAEFSTAIINMGIAGQFAHIVSEKPVQTKEKTTIVIKRENTVQLGTEYENIVNNRAIKENVSDTIQLQGLPDYLERINKFITRHKTKGTLYLSALPVSAKVTYYSNGNLISLDDIRDIMYAKDLPTKSSKPKTQGELENSVQWRRYSMDNVQTITTMGKTFIF